MLHRSFVAKEPSLRLRQGYRPDFRLGNTLIELKEDLRSFRNLRAALLQLAYYLTDEPDKHGVLLLVNPRITEEALQKEWQSVERTLHPAIVGRLALMVRKEAEIIKIAGTLHPGFEKNLVDDIKKLLSDEINQKTHAKRYRAPRSLDAILLVLLNQWLMRKGPMTTKWLMQAVGCSYPTAANALRRMQHVIKHFPDRRFQLWGFPTEEWQRIVSDRDAAHPTLHYADRSGQPRNTESLLRRASALNRDDIAVGGVIAARYYYPNLNLRGTPRLDLTVHNLEGRADLSFIEELDPALERISGKDEPAILAIHVLRRQASLFEPTGDDLPRVDPVLTLLDLYDARLELQAKDFLDHLVTSVG